MSGIVWRKLKIVTSSKPRVLLFLLMPFVLLAIYHLRGINLNHIISVFPYFCMCVNLLLFFSVEDLIFSEVILSTPVTPRDIWIYNSKFITAISYFYSNLVLLGYVAYLFISGQNVNISIYSVLFNVVSILYMFAMSIASTVHLSDYSKVTQLIASVFAIINIIFMIELVIANILILPNMAYILAFLSISVIIIIFAFAIFRSGNKEKLIINTTSFVKSYDASENILSE